VRRAQTLGLSIAEVSRQTGIPVTTLRFYERELPGLLPVRKTTGGHRRYRSEDVARLDAVRRLTHAEGLKLSDVRRVMASRGDAQSLREEVDRLRAILRRQSDTLDELLHRLSRLEARLGELEARPRRKWFK
jgi:MerR family transcriptional regulator, copper efflux regulator